MLCQRRFTRAALFIISLFFVSSVLGQPDTAPLAPFSITLANVRLAVTLSEVNLRRTASANGGIIQGLPPNTSLDVIGEETGTAVSINGYTSSLWLHVDTSAGAGYVWSGLAAYLVTDPALSGIQLLIQPGVSDSEVNAVAAGAWAALQAMGQETVEATIKVFNRSASPTGEDACCLLPTADPESIYINVLHPVWQGRDAIGKAESVNQELQYRWQRDVARCVGQEGNSPLGLWLTEGWAEYRTVESTISADWMTETEAWERKTLFLTTLGLADPTLENWVAPNAEDFRSHFGPNWSYLAVHWLVQEHGEDVLEQLCDAARLYVGQQASWENFPTVFEAAVGMPVEQFYPAFYTYTGALVANLLGLGSEFPDDVWPEVEPQGESQIAIVTQEPPQEILNAHENGCIDPTYQVLGELQIWCVGVNLENNLAGWIVQGAAFEAVKEYGVSIPQRYNPDNVLLVTVPEFTRNGITSRMELQLDLQHDMVYVRPGVFQFLPRELYTPTITFHWRGESVAFRFVIPET